MGRRAHPNDDFKENSKFNEWKIVNTVLLRGNSQKEVIGTNLPESAEDIHSGIVVDTSTRTKSIWIVAELPQVDFDILTNQLELTKEIGLLTIWPEAFDCEKKELKEFWNITKSVDENTYYGKDTQIESKIMVKYEEGKLYVKRSIYYDGKIGKDGQIYLKERRR